MKAKDYFHPEIVANMRRHAYRKVPKAWKKIPSDIPGVNMDSLEYGGIPFDDGSDYSNWTRLHELAHVKYTPTQERIIDSIDERALTASNASYAAAEDARINMLACLYLPNGKKYARKCDVTVPEIWKRLACMPNQTLLYQHLAGSIGTKAEKTAIKALKGTPYEKRAEEFYKAAKGLLGYTPKGRMSRRAGDYSSFARQTVPLANLIEACGNETLAPMAEKRKPAERSFGPRPNDARPIPTIEHPPLVRDSNRAFRKKRGSVSGGRVGRADVVANGSGPPYKKLLTTVGDPVLVIDTSGSMSFTTEHLNEIMNKCPFATVLTYSGRGNRSSIIIQAHNGKRVNQVQESDMYGNEIDDLALLYACQIAKESRSHVVWYSDGGVCSDHLPEEVMEANVLDILLNGPVTWCISFKAASRALEKKGLTYTLEKEFPPNSGMMYGNNIERGIQNSTAVYHWREIHDQQAS